MLQNNGNKELPATCWYCAYNECSSRSRQGFALFRFPNDVKRAKAWLVACRREDLLEHNVFDVRNNYRLCEKHFEDKYILKSGSTRLRARAIPTIFPHLKRKAGEASVANCNSDDKNMEDGKDSESVQGRRNGGGAIVQATPRCRILRKKKIICCVSRCANRKRGETFYKFPQSLLLVNLWKSALRLPNFHNVCKLCVCEQHFDRRDFCPGTKSLKKMAIPSLHRNDEKKKQIPVLEKRIADCYCKCTCGKRQNSLGLATLEAVESFHKYSKPNTEASSTVEAVPTQTNKKYDLKLIVGENSFSISELNKFEQSEIKRNTIVVSDRNARVLINSENSSLRLELAVQVQKVLLENTNLNIAKENAESTDKIDLEPNSQNNDQESVPKMDLQDRTCMVQEAEISSKEDSQPNNGKKKGSDVRKKYEEIHRFFGTKCPYCGFNLKRVGDLLRHIKQVHYGLFRSGPISDEAIHEELMKQIEVVEKEEAEFPTSYLNSNFKVYCQYCDAVFPGVAMLTIHVKDVHETFFGPPHLREAQLKRGIRNCQFCNRVSHNMEEHNSHVEQCVRKKPDQHQICEFCGKIIHKNHMRTHITEAHDAGIGGKKRFFCEKCGLILSTKSIYQSHMLRHENKREFRCSTEGCSKVFNTPSGLQTHQLIHVPPEICQYVCEDCGKRFPRQSYLSNHKEIFHSLVLYQCKHCSKVIRGKNAYGIHVRINHPQGAKKLRIAPQERRPDAGGGRGGERSAGKRQRRAQKTGELEEGMGGSKSTRTRKLEVSASEEGDSKKPWISTRTKRAVGGRIGDLGNNKKSAVTKPTGVQKTRMLEEMSGNTSARGREWDDSRSEEDEPKEQRISPRERRVVGGDSGDLGNNKNSAVKRQRRVQNTGKLEVGASESDRELEGSGSGEDKPKKQWICLRKGRVVREGSGDLRNDRKSAGRRLREMHKPSKEAGANKAKIIRKVRSSESEEYDPLGEKMAGEMFGLDDFIEDLSLDGFS